MKTRHLIRKIVWVSKLFFRAERVEENTGLGGANLQSCEAEHIRALSSDVRSKAQSRVRHLLLPLLALALGSCAPSQDGPRVLSTTMQFDITCSSALSQLRNASAHLRPVPYPLYGWEAWSELMVDRWTDTQLVLSSQRGVNRALNMPFRPMFLDESRLYTVVATCQEINRSSTVTLQSTGLRPELMERVHARLFSGVTVF